MKPYEKLAVLYDKNWGKFSLGYLKIIKHISEKYKFKPQSVLDIACGTGKLISAFSKKGFEVAGIDLSLNMIRVAKKRNKNLFLRVGNMSKLKLNKKFDLITCAFDSINYLLGDKEVKSTFIVVYRHLNDKGWFIFDVNTPYLYKASHKGIFEREINKIKFKQTLEYDAKKRLAVTLFDFGKNKKEKHTQKAYTKREISRFLRYTGFKITEIYQDFYLKKPVKESKRLFFVASKT